MGWILGAIKILFLLGLLITIHELGHFLVAKFFKVKIDKFAIGFGPKILKKQKGETEYTVRAIPFGGFVQMEGEEEHSDNERAFNNKPVWQRMLIIVAGATVNIIFALILYFGLSFSSDLFISSKVNEVLPGTAAESAGLQKDDEIIKVNGEKIYDKFGIDRVMASNKGEEVTVTLKREKEIQEVMFVPDKTTYATIGISISEENVIQSVTDPKLQEEEIILPGDVIYSVNGKVDLTASEVAEEIGDTVAGNLNLELNRNGENVAVEVEPTIVNRYTIGITCLQVPPTFGNKVYYGLHDTAYYLTATLEGIGSLFTGKAENVQLMGPVGIAQSVGKEQPLPQYIYWMSAISLSLGIFNLFPIPGLDGGKFLFLIIEAIRKKPMQQKHEAALQLIGFSLLLILSIGVTIMDIGRIFG